MYNLIGKPEQNRLGIAAKNRKLKGQNVCTLAVAMSFNTTKLMMKVNVQFMFLNVISN